MTRIFFIITFSLSLSSLTSQLITEHTLLDLLFNALVCVFFYFCITFSFKFKIMVHVRGARAGASGILPFRAGMCLIAIGGGLGAVPPIVMSLYLIEKSNPRRTAGCTVRKQSSVNRFMTAIIMKDLDVVVMVVFCIVVVLLIFFLLL